MNNPADVVANNHKLLSKATLLPWLICCLGALFYCYEYFLRVSPSVMTHDLMAAYRIDATSLGNLAAFYYYAYTPMQLPVGVMMDHYGPRRLLIFASLVCAVGTFLFGAHGPLWLAWLGRFMVGFGSAFAFVGVLKLATIWLPSRYFAMISGLATSLGMVGAMLGETCMSALVKFEGWQQAVMLSGITGILLAAIFGWLMPGHKEDVMNMKASQLKEFKSLLKGVSHLVAKPTIWINGLVGCLLYLPLSAFAEMWGVPYLEVAHHFTSTQAATAISFVFLGWGLSGPFAGWISDRLERPAYPMFWGGLCTAIIIAFILYTPTISDELLYLLLFAFGAFSSVQVIVFAMGRSLSSERLSGTAVAFTNMLVMVGGMVFQPMVGILLDHQWDGAISHGVHIYSLDNYTYALFILPIAAIIGASLTLFINRRRSYSTQ